MELKSKMLIYENELHIKKILTLPHRRMQTIHPMYFTFNPEAWDQATLFFQTHNGGSDVETFKLGKSKIHHSDILSTLISSKHGLGATEGIIVIGDKEKQISIWHDQTKSALIPSIYYMPINKKQYFLRIQYSAQELDETLKEDIKKHKICCNWKINANLNLNR